MLPLLYVSVPQSLLSVFRFYLVSIFQLLLYFFLVLILLLHESKWQMIFILFFFHLGSWSFVTFVLKPRFLATTHPAVFSNLSVGWYFQLQYNFFFYDIFSCNIILSFIYLILFWFSSIQLGVLKHFCPLGYFGLRGTEKFWAQKIEQEKLSQFAKILNYIKFSCIIFCAKLF